jgi:hypothetical protein
MTTFPKNTDELAATAAMGIATMYGSVLAYAHGAPEMLPEGKPRMTAQLLLAAAEIAGVATACYAIRKLTKAQPVPQAQPH